MSYNFNTPWVDGPAGGTPLSAGRLNNDEQGIQSAGGAWANVKDPDYAGGAKGDGTTNDTAAIQAALNAVSSAGGGTVYVPRGTYPITPNSLTIPADNISVIGAGGESSVLLKTADGWLLDMSGTTTTSRYRVRLADLKLAGGDHGGALVRGYYTQFLVFERVLFYGNSGAGFTAVQCWDSLFYRCRWDWVHGEWWTASPTAAVHLKISDQGVSSGFGFSADNCNNVNFFNCTWEQNQGHDVWFDGRKFDGTYAGRINECTFTGRTKMEEATGNKAASHILLDNVDDITFDSLQTSVKGAYGGTPIDMVKVVRGLFVDLGHMRSEAIETTSGSGIRTALSVGDSTSFFRADLAMWAQTNNKPTVAAVEFTGTSRANNTISAGYLGNPGAATLQVGTPNG